MRCSFLVSGFALLFSILIGEAAVRYLFHFNPTYYLGLSDLRSSDIQYPYGTIHFNTDGFPDIEFQPKKTKPRVGYFGDSVCFGVGAGAKYRISDLLRDDIPQLEHLNFAAIGSGIDDAAGEKILTLTERYQLDMVVYLMNLNDILPAAKADAEQNEGAAKSHLRSASEWIRRRSYLYSLVRFVFKYRLHLFFDRSALPQFYELFPYKNQPIIQATVERIASLNRELSRSGVAFLTIILPYEIQISPNAAKVYQELGVKWEDGFQEGSVQRLIKEALASFGVKFLDVAPAFADVKESAPGDYFVFTRGGNLDWNHPNRAGHQKIARYIGPFLRGGAVE